ncbi:hypothetical protein DL764_003123 [Monosporascus ibericus]|uniref:Uncharacterized protein n=1 Tax=Monosporascus ibericus TaxID=155417 RepID=A0A4Q4TMF6_9PEZI|nr:hypothetical protein DL764_003123 [Monosporascus ibericus]
MPQRHSRRRRLSAVLWALDDQTGAANWLTVGKRPNCHGDDQARNPAAAPRKSPVEILVLRWPPNDLFPVARHHLPLKHLVCGRSITRAQGTVPTILAISARGADAWAEAANKAETMLVGSFNCIAPQDTSTLLQGTAVVVDAPVFGNGRDG